eukprot:scaffold13912_cov108-Isochrysis_galbana.AAC.2
MDIQITAAPEPAATVWQWLDLPTAQLSSATEANWHTFAPEHSAIIQQAAATAEHATIMVGLSQYTIRDFDGPYAAQVSGRAEGYPFCILGLGGLWGEGAGICMLGF